MDPRHDIRMPAVMQARDEWVTGKATYANFRRVLGRSEITLMKKGIAIVSGAASAVVALVIPIAGQAQLTPVVASRVVQCAKSVA